MVSPWGLRILKTIPEKDNLGNFGAHLPTKNHEKVHKKGPLFSGNPEKNVFFFNGKINYKRGDVQLPCVIGGVLGISYDKNGGCAWKETLYL